MAANAWTSIKACFLHITDEIRINSDIYDVDGRTDKHSSQEGYS